MCPQSWNGSRMRRSLIALGVSAGLVLATASGAQAAASLDQEVSGTLPAGVAAPISNTLWYAQAVTAGVTGSLDAVDLVLWKTVAATSALTLTVYSTSSGLPSGAPLASQSLDPSQVPAIEGWVTFTFDQPALFRAGTQFALVLTTPAATVGPNDPYLWSAIDGGPTSPYAGGYSSYSTGGSWTGNTTIAEMFRTYVTPRDIPSATDSATPAPVMQQFGHPGLGTCSDAAPIELNWAGVPSGGWGESWAQWMNDGAGGAVCSRTLIYDNSLARWILQA